MAEAPKKQGQGLLQNALHIRLLVDELVGLNAEKATQMRVVDEGKT